MTTKPVVLTPYVHEGDAGCLAGIPELDLEVGMPTRHVALSSLKVLVRSNCIALLQRGASSHATEAQMKLAAEIIEKGFDFRWPKRPAHEVLLDRIRWVTTITAAEEDWFPDWQVEVLKAHCGVLRDMVILVPVLKDVIKELDRIKGLPHFPESMREKASIREIVLDGILKETIEVLSVDLLEPEMSTT